jgi:ribonuclease HI
LQSSRSTIETLQRSSKTSSSTLIPYSLSSLESIEQLYPTRHPLLNQIQDVIQNLAVDKNITFVWVPGHSDIQGNETAAKAATNLQMPPDLKMSTCDLKLKIKKESLATINMLNIKRTTKRWESIEELKL